MLLMSCSFLAALIRASSVLQKLLYCGFVRYCLNEANMFWSLLGIPDRILNMVLNMVDTQISFDTVHHETANYQLFYTFNTK